MGMSENVSIPIKKDRETIKEKMINHRIWVISYGQIGF
jgi:hypothetical protein